VVRLLAKVSETQSVHAYSPIYIVESCHVHDRQTIAYLSTDYSSLAMPS